jgi:hypothetical protein
LKIAGREKMKSALFTMLITLSSCFILLSCSEQTALNREDQEKKSDTNINAAFLEKQEKEAETATRYKILIAQFACLTNGGIYSKPEIYRTIFFNSFYNLFSVLPSIDIPDKSILEELDPSESNVGETAEKSLSDFIVFGDYTLTGSKTKPEALVNLKIWSKFNGKILTNTYKTPTDADLFDSIDSMMGRIVKTVLNEEMKIAYLNFDNIDTGREKLGIFINHRLIAEPVSNDFNLNMKILSGTDYRVSVRRFFDGRLLYGRLINLNPGDSLNISATNYRVNLISANGHWWHSRGVISEHVNGEYHIRFKYGGQGNWWDHQFEYSSFTLTNGTRYRVSFDARASENMDIYAKLRGSEKVQYKAYWGSPTVDDKGAPKRIGIGPELKTYIFTFHMLSQTDNNVSFEFDLGRSYGNIWISNVWVEEID